MNIHVSSKERRLVSRGVVRVMMYVPPFPRRSLPYVAVLCFDFVWCRGGERGRKNEGVGVGVEMQLRGVWF